MLIKNNEEIKLIKKSSLLTSKTLGILASKIIPGINLLTLDKIAKEFILDNGGKPAFLGLYNYPNTICSSVNNEVVHSIPKNLCLKNGDIVSIDCGVLMNNYYGEHAYTFGVGKINKIKKKLLKVTKKSLYIGIKSCKVGNKIGDIGYNINKYILKNNFNVVKDLVGHGIGKNIHEFPNIPNYGKKSTGLSVCNGMVLSIEPIVNQGTYKIKLCKDGWTYITKDGSLSAHYEHNIAIINKKPILLSTFNYIDKILKKNANYSTINKKKKKNY
ncbi:MAG: type I methionyl aminopeptidase [Candidatus Shikimatogenerans bostrichidophilus]|nr:MAG: type I methionyl aminopeptidase [Candidatus Shikimatogenerans bostrichidophilus]